MRGRPRRLGVTDRGRSMDRILQAAALVMLPGGFAAIVLGWYGAARTPLVFEQIPYLISGGLLGSGLVFGGGLLYLASWLSRLAALQREDAAALRDLLAARQREDAAALRDLLVGLRAQQVVPVEPAETFLTTPTGTMFHLPACSVVAGRDDVHAVRGDEPGLRPCKLCLPG